MSIDCKYGFGCYVDLDFDATVARVESLLESKQFQIYTRLTLHEIVARAENDAFGRYIILGACNPEFARLLFNADPDIGLLVPCNIAVYETGTGRCKVMIKDPARIMDMISSPVAIETSISVKERLEELIEELR